MTASPEYKWDLEDYPVEEQQQVRTPEQMANLPGRLIPWIVRIPGWLRMSGYGDTRAEAWADLRQKFAAFKAEGNPLPAPGSQVPLEFAPQDNIAQYDVLAEDFFRRVLNMDYGAMFVSDQSALSDFPGKSQKEIAAKVRKVYGIDVSDIEDGNIVRILKRLSSKR